MDAFTPATELAAAIRSRAVSPTEVAELFLARIEALDPRLNAFAHQDPERVRAAAARATEQVAAVDADQLAPFHGVPLPIKDLTPVEGWPCTYGSRATSRAPQPASDPLVERFVAGGFVPLGVTTSPEFGTISFTESDAHGITRNPWDPARTPGGSSGGSAAAVASGMAPIAHANDGGGSIRIPAACCGLVGHKPSRGRVPTGAFELEGFVADHVVARTVADSAAALDVTGAVDPLAWVAAPPPPRPYAQLVREDPGPLRVAYLTAAPIDVPVDPAAAAGVEVACRALEAAGHHVEEAVLDMPDPDAFIGAFTAVWNTGSAWTTVERPDEVEPLNQALAGLARLTDSYTFAESVRDTQAMVRTVLANFGSRVDVLITPTLAVLPPEVGAWREGMDAEPIMGLLNCTPMAAFTAVWNVCGSPATSVPVHHDEASGLPVGVQVVGPPWRDDLCLQVAAQLEAALPWHDRRPPVS